MSFSKYKFFTSHELSRTRHGEYVNITIGVGRFRILGGQGLEFGGGGQGLEFWGGGEIPSRHMTS